MSLTPSTSSLPDLGQAEQLLEHFEQLEARFEQVRAGLTQSHRLTTLGTLTAVVAHEYNNILTPIISYAQMASAKPDDLPLLRKAVEKALDGAQRAATISSAILGFASSQTQTGDAHLPTVVDESIQCLARAPAKDGITLELDVADLTLAINPVALQQVLVNLALNARKAMRRRGGTLRIHAQAQGGQALIRISDTGPGIAAAIVDRLFEPFVTCPSDTSPGPGDEPGTGLGLCICRDLVTAASGTITCVSQASSGVTSGEGAVFEIMLPLATDE